MLTLSAFSDNVNNVSVVTMTDTRAIFKSLFIYNFATLVDWPSEYRKGDFIIGVYGTSNSVYDELTKKYNGKAVGSQKIIVEKYTSKSSIDKTPHILYLTPDKSNDIEFFDEKYKKKSTLLITEREGYLKKGAVINFVVDRENNNKQTYEISKENAKKHNLIIASKLISLALRVE
jgi:hypothetical protein